MEQRAIKFRAWDKNLNRMSLGMPLESFTRQDNTEWFGSRIQFGKSFVPFSDCVIMQFTGLQDKAGEDIYEGDIYKTFYSRDTSGEDIVEVIETVEWSDNSAGEVGYEILFFHNAEVIGNIYENETLLNAKIK